LSLRVSAKLSEREALKQVDLLVARIKRSATRLPDGAGERAKRLAQAEVDFWFFGRTYFPHHCTCAPAECHYAMVASWRDPGAEIDRLPRGWAKTTLGQIYGLWGLLFGKKQFMLVIGKSGDNAAEIVQTMVLELEENERLLQDFGDQHTQWWNVATGYRLRKTGAWLRGIGRGESVRGSKKGAARPDFILADDIEDEELVRNPQRVKRLLKWWVASVLPALSKNGTAVWLCTSLSQKSPSTLLLDPEYKLAETEEPPDCRRLSFPALNPEGESTWPEMWSTERLFAKKAQIGSSAFNQEFLHLAEMVGGMFRGSWFQKFTNSNLQDDSIRQRLVIAVGVDPSVKAKETSDPKAIVAWGRDLETDLYYCLYAWIQRKTVTEFIKKLYEIQDLLRPQIFLLEAQGFANLLTIPIKNEGMRRGVRLPIRLIEQSVAKETRVQQLEPMAENGQLWYQPGHSDQNELIEEFEYFPSSGKPDDGPDASQMAIEYLRLLRKSGSQSGYQAVGKRVKMGEIF